MWYFQYNYINDKVKYNHTYMRCFLCYFCSIYQLNVSSQWQIINKCAFTMFSFRSPIAVGVTTVSRKDMFEDGMRGKGVKILHVFTDFLW